MSEITAETSKDALGLDLDSLKLSDDQPKPAPVADEDKPTVSAPETPVATASEAPSEAEQPETASTAEVAAQPPAAGGDKKPPPREKNKPYINPERVKTGGTQREKLSEDELAQRMARIREQNEKIKQRRIDVEADEQEFKKTQAEERMKQARNKKVQENVDKAREQNARRKLDKIQNREWDSGKPGVKRSGPPEPSADAANQAPPQTASIGIRGGVRGGGGGRGGRGRGRGGNVPRAAAGPSSVIPPTGEKPAETATAAAAATPSS